MKKAVLFVEGQTEQLFAEMLITQIGGSKHIVFEKRQTRGGSKIKRSIKLIQSIPTVPEAQFHVQIIDCGADNRVKSDIRDNYDKLTQAGYTVIVGMMDVYPNDRSSLGRIMSGLPLYLKTVPVKVDFVLPIMEIEAWFLAEHTHFLKVSPILTPAFIHRNHGFDPSIEDMQLRDHPAADLDAIYKRAGQAYTKRKTVVQRTVSLLDYASLYLDLSRNYTPLGRLVQIIDSFLS